ncbi:MAG: hypothetical protein ABI203_02795 [Mucilaginibacter sp.]
MSYEILITAESVSILHITAINFNSLNGWRIEFHDGKEAMVYNENNEWIQYDKSWLDKPTLVGIGYCIERRMVEKSTGITDSRYFYDTLVN